MDMQKIAEVAEVKTSRPRQLKFVELTENGTVPIGDELSEYLQITNISTGIVHEIASSSITHKLTANMILFYGLRQICGDYQNTKKGKERDTAIAHILAELTNPAGISKAVRAASGARLGQEKAKELAVGLDLTPAQQAIFDARLAAMFAARK